jgi:hypothetical protein
MTSGPVLLAVVVAVATVAVVAFACGWLRPRVSKHRRYALSLAAPAVPLAAAAGFSGSALAAVLLGCGVVLCAAAAWSFWPTGERAWRRFEADLWRSVTERQG